MQGVYNKSREMPARESRFNVRRRSNHPFSQMDSSIFWDRGCR